MRITDPKIREQLEGLRLRVPRYLFRGWSEKSGGNEKCNSTTAITPAAFIQGSGHESICDMSTELFKKMVLSHLQGRRDVPTELSSWTASISFAMRWCLNPHSSFISIIDTKKLGEKVEIVYAPDLNSFVKGTTDYEGEYLAHGIIDGECHRAVPFRAFTDLEISLQTMPLLAPEISGHLRNTKRFVHTCRRIGEQYGIVAALAIIAFFMAIRGPPTLYVSQQERNIIEEELGDLHVPEKWYNDDSIMKDFIVADFDQPEVKEFIELLRLFARRLLQKHASDGQLSQGDPDPAKIDAELLRRANTPNFKRP